MTSFPVFLYQIRQSWFFILRSHMNKKTLSTELSYLLGIIFLALGTALETFANFGMSTAVAPAYLIYLKVSQTLPWFTFGMAEYCTQLFLLVVMMLIVRRFKMSYLFSFITAIIYGLFLDLFLKFTMTMPNELTLRILAFAVGTICVSAGVSLIFHTYISPEVYELFVSEVSSYFGIKIHVFKTGYDIASCIAALIMSLLFFSHIEGIGIGTVISALINGTLIGWFTKLFERRLNFSDKWKLRPYFEA
jgi:hypothetical protein